MNYIRDELMRIRDIGDNTWHNAGTPLHEIPKMMETLREEYLDLAEYVQQASIEQGSVLAILNCLIVLQSSKMLSLNAKVLAPVDCFFEKFDEYEIKLIKQ